VNNGLPSSVYAPGALLLIEGDEVTAAAVLAYAASEGIAARHTADLNTGLALLPTEGFEVVVVSLDLPMGMDALLHFVQEPVAVLAIVSDPARIDDAFQLGAQEVLARGEVDHQRLVGAIRTALRVAESDARAHQAEIELRDRDRRLRSVVGNDSGGSAEFGRAARMASLGELAAGIVHEINNPLTYVLFNMAHLNRELPELLGGMERLLKVLTDELGEERASELVAMAHLRRDSASVAALLECAHEVADGANRIRDITWDLKAFSKTEEDTIAPIAVQRTLDAALSMAESELKYQARVEKDYKEVSRVLGNDARLTQVFVNLLVNAAQSFEGVNRPSNVVTVRTWEDDESVFVEIGDNGCGIPAEHMQRLVDPFFSAKAGGRKGTGLGLSIVHNILASTGGHLEIASTLGEGTRVCVALPRARRKGGAITASLSPQGTRGRLLVIDEDPLIGTAIQRIAQRDYDAVVLSAGEAAVTLLEGNDHFDLILCDLNMPGMSGMDLFDWVRSHRPELVRKMVFMTGGAFTPRATRFVYEVSNPVVEKPFDVEEFGVRLAELIERARFVPVAGPLG